MQQITLNEKRYSKKVGFKNAYQLTEDKTEIVTSKQHGLCTSEDTCKWFRRLGGSETVTRSYTCAGYLVTKLISTSPNKDIRVIREFNFKWID